MIGVGIDRGGHGGDAAGRPRLAAPAFGRLRARFRKHAATPDQAAQTILRGVRRNRYLVYTSWDIPAIHEIQNRVQPLYVLIMRVVNRLANRAVPMPKPTR